MLVFTFSTCYSCPILVKVAFSRQFFETNSNIKFHENPSSGSRVVPCGETDGQTDRHTEVNSRFRNFVNAPKNETLKETSILVKTLSKTWRLCAAQLSQLFHDHPKTSVYFSYSGPMSPFEPFS